MTREFIETPSFQKQWQRLGLDETELEDLQNAILIDPEIGALIQGSGGVRKIRVRFPGRGKSGSCRVGYVDFPEYGSTFLLTVYSKKQKENLSDKEKEALRLVVKQIRDNLRRRALYGE